MFSSSEILDIAVRLEENGESFYRQALNNVSEASLRSALERVADEELQHREWFLKMKKSENVQSNNLLAEQIGGTFLQDALNQHALSLDEVDVRSIRDEDTLLQMAIGFEQDTIIFYEIIGAFVADPTASERISQIIDEERKHIVLLQERLQTGRPTLSFGR